MQIRPATGDDLGSMKELAGRLQTDPAGAIAYLAVEPAGIESELIETDWQSVSALAFDADRLIGWLVADIDAELGRVYWLGPFVEAQAWNEVASALYAGCSALLAPEVTQQEMAIDVRFERCQTWATGHGFEAGTASLALVLDSELDGPGEEFRAVGDDDLGALGVLHEQLFPGTHTTGRQLVEDRDERHVRLIAEIDGGVVGYVAFEVQPDGSGYLDFLGVAPHHRRRGLGAQLVRAAVAMLLEQRAAPIHLTVREDNLGARALYASLGFNVQRTIRPLRKGFTLT